MFESYQYLFSWTSIIKDHTASAFMHCDLTSPRLGLQPGFQKVSLPDGQSVLLELETSTSLAFVYNCCVRINLPLWQKGTVARLPFVN